MGAWRLIPWSGGEVPGLLSELYHAD